MEQSFLEYYESMDEVIDIEAATIEFPYVAIMDEPTRAKYEMTYTDPISGEIREYVISINYSRTNHGVMLNFENKTPDVNGKYKKNGGTPFSVMTFIFKLFTTFIKSRRLNPAFFTWIGATDDADKYTPVSSDIYDGMIASIGKYPIPNVIRNKLTNHSMLTRADMSVIIAAAQKNGMYNQAGTFNPVNFDIVVKRNVLYKNVMNKNFPGKIADVKQDGMFTTVKFNGDLYNYDS